MVFYTFIIPESIIKLRIEFLLIIDNSSSKLSVYALFLLYSDLVSKLCVFPNVALMSGKYRKTKY